MIRSLILHMLWVKAVLLSSLVAHSVRAEGFSWSLLRPINCGIYCCYITLRESGSLTSLTSVNTALSSELKGGHLSLLAMKTFLAENKVKSEGRRYSGKTLPDAYPFIAQISLEANQSHYIYVRRKRKGQLLVIDVIGDEYITQISVEDFLDSWNGIALFLPGLQAERG